MKSLKRETLLQLTGSGKYLMCTAIPVFDRIGKLHKIISYTRDVTKYEALKEEYENLKDTLALYSTQLGQLRQQYQKDLKIVGNSLAIKKVLTTVEKISKFDANVLLTGESGVGKTMIAEAIHALSQRNDQPFISINCGAIPENLLESELFGYEKGAFTGANQDGKPGMIELAHKGVLFLDEIGDLPTHMQVKLLKVIQDKKVTRVGGVKEKQVDFRLIAATNKDINKLIEENKFREDLYYRLNVISIHIPPLRERREDIFYLVTHFVKKYNEIYKVNHVFSNKAMDYLESYAWHGNTREIENLVERMVITADDYIITEDMLPQSIYKKETIDNYNFKNKSLKEILEYVEKQVILDSYKEYRTTTRVAEALGISQPSVSIKLNKYLNKADGASDKGSQS
jgi:transcriptional regulator with PAS, ATPase and Fis domain